MDALPGLRDIAKTINLSNIQRLTTPKDRLEIESGVMTIEGNRTYKINGEEVSKSIHKQFKLGTEYNAELIEATIEDGLLTVFIPGFKKQEKKKISLL